MDGAEAPAAGGRGDLDVMQPGVCTGNGSLILMMAATFVQANNATMAATYLRGAVRCR